MNSHNSILQRQQIVKTFLILSIKQQVFVIIISYYSFNNNPQEKKECKLLTTAFIKESHLKSVRII